MKAKPSPREVIRTIALEVVSSLAIVGWVIMSFKKMPASVTVLGLLAIYVLIGVLRVREGARKEALRIREVLERSRKPG